MVFSPIYLVVMNWFFPLRFCFIGLNTLDMRALDICLAYEYPWWQGELFWFTWYMFWHSTRGFPRWHWGNLCIGVDARSCLCFSGRNLGALFLKFFVLDWVLLIWNYLVLFYYEILDRSTEKNSFEVVSYPTNDFFLCSPLDRNFGVILRCTLRDGYMIQLY